MTEVRATADAGTFARALANVLALCPARSEWPIVRMEIGGGLVRFTASDSYTAGRDEVVGETSGNATVALARSVAQTVESSTRAQRKQSVMVHLSDEDPLGGRLLSLSIHGGMEIMPPTRVAKLSDTVENARGPEADLFALVDRALEDLDGRDVAAPPGAAWEIAFQQSLIQPFAKVRCQEDHEVVDMLIWDSSRPILLKIGSTFRGMIIPIRRDSAPGGALF